MTTLPLTPSLAQQFSQLIAISPEEPADVPGASSGDHSPSVLTGKKVLVVEDEYLVGLEMVQTVESWGMSVTGPIQTLKDAEATSLTAEWDGAILDVNLDGHDTLDLARRLRKRGLVVIFVTAYASNDSRFAGDLSSIPRLGKPIPYRTLRRILVDALK